MGHNALRHVRFASVQFVLVSWLLAVIVGTSFFFCATANAQNSSAPTDVTNGNAAEGSGSVQGTQECAAQWALASYWWVPVTEIGGTEFRQCELADLAVRVGEVCSGGAIVFGIASGNTEASGYDEQLADQREIIVRDYLREQGITAELSGPGGPAHAGEGEYGVRVWCLGGGYGGIDAGPAPSYDADSTSADVELEPQLAALEAADSEGGGDAEAIRDLGRRVQSQGRQIRELQERMDEEGSGEGANGPTVRLLVRPTFQHRRTVNGFGGDLGLIVDLGPAIIEGGVSLGGMAPIFQDGSALGQTVGGFAQILFQTSESFSVGPGFRFEENMGSLLNGDDLSLYQRLVPGLRFDLRFGEEKSWNAWADLLYEHSVDAGALAPNGAGIAIGIGRNISTWGNLGVMVTAVPEALRW